MKASLQTQPMYCSREYNCSSRERTFSRNYGNNRDRSSSNSRSRSGSQASTNRDGIRCYNCREYDHFARDCPNSREERAITTDVKFGS